MSEPLRIVYITSPPDIISTYDYWKKGRHHPAQVGITYSSQLFEVCRDMRAKLLAVSIREDHATVRDGNFTILHRRNPLQAASSVWWHLGQMISGVRIVLWAIRFRADFCIMTAGTYWFVLCCLPLFGIRIVPSIHCILWHKYRPLKTSASIVRNLSRCLFTKRSFAIMSASADIGHQIDELTGGKHRPVAEFLPTYVREQFENIPQPEPTDHVFRVLFAGRIETDKGVFDLLDVAKRFEAEGHRDVVFDICGTGSQLDALRERAAHAGLDSRFRIHGHCDQGRMREMFGRSHAVIAPTTTAFIEGFNQVVVESILSGRPVITSPVCPAIAYVRDAGIEVPPDDADAYGDAILRLKQDPALYEAKRRACAALQEQFYDPDRGWAAALRRIIAAHQADAEPEPVSWLPRADIPR
jgi:glycosyltransferase involved in cell wall biosynthesis